MVAKTPSNKKRMAAALNPSLVRETVMKVDRCMARLQELQYTVSGGTKVASGVSLSPRSTRGYLRTSLRCKQESQRIKNSTARKSPVGKFPEKTTGEWRRMSLPAMLLGETVVEILQASQFAKEVVVAAATTTTNRKIAVLNDPKTPVSARCRNKTTHYEITGLQARRSREKQSLLRTIRSESDSPPLPRARSHISFKPNNSPPNRRRENDTHRHVVAAHRVSPKNRPWAKKTVLFPNPIFLSSPTSHQQKFCKTGSPVISRTKQTPHKFLIKSPPSAAPKFQVRIKNTPAISLSPTKPTGSKSKSSAVAANLRRSFSPSRLAKRLVSPLKSRISPKKRSIGSISSWKQQQQTKFSTPVRLSNRRI